MATGILKLRGASTAVRLAATPADREIFVDTDTYKVYIGDGATAGGIEIGAGVAGNFATLTKTANYTILTADNGIRFNNIGAGGAVILTLPTAAASLQFGGAVFVGQYLEFLANGSDVISIAGNSSAGGGYVRSNDTFSSITLEAHSSGRWVASSLVGSWTIDS